MKYEEDAEQAGEAGLPEDKTRELLTDIARGDDPPSLSDEELDQDIPPSTDEPLSAEQAILKQKGASYVHHLNSMVDAAQRMKAKAMGAVDGLMEELKQAVFARLSAFREKYPDATVGLIAAVLLALVIPAAVLGEVHLLVKPLADWMGMDHLDTDKTLKLASAAAVVLSFLSWLAHQTMDETQPAFIRVVWGLGLLLSSLLICYLRSSQALVEDQGQARLVLYAWWSWVSFGAPIVTERFITWFLASLKTYLRFKADQGYHIGIVGWFKERVAEQHGIIAEADRQNREVVQEYVDSYRELAFARDRKNELSRSTRRQRESLLGQLMIVYHHAKKRSLGISHFVPSLIALVLLGVLAFMVLSARSAHAEEGLLPASVLVICDRSSSSAGGLACDERRIEAVFDTWAEKAVDRRKGSFEVLIVGNQITDTSVFFTENAPEQIAVPLSLNKRRWARAAKARLRQKPLPDRDNTSAILEAIYAASFRISGVPGERRVVLMSDLRYIGGPFNFERQVPASAEFLKYLESLPSQPDLRGVDLTVCGFHTAAFAGQRIGVQNFLMLRQVWTEAFRLWGLHDVPIMEECKF